MEAFFLGPLMSCFTNNYLQRGIQGLSLITIYRNRIVRALFQWLVDQLTCGLTYWGIAAGNQIVLRLSHCWGVEIIWNRLLFEPLNIILKGIWGLRFGSGNIWSVGPLDYLTMDNWLKDGPTELGLNGKWYWNGFGSVAWMFA